MNKNMEPGNLDEEIRKKLSGWKRTRSNRISASERFKKYDSRWGIITLFMNTLAIIMVLWTLKFPLKSGIDGILSGGFSIYVILLQDLLGKRDYSARSLKLHYEQLEIESLRYRLKGIYGNKYMDQRKKQQIYNNIVNEYQASLRGNENHNKIDDRLYNEKEDGKSQIKKDVTLDNAFIYINCIIFGISLISFYMINK